MEIVIRTDSHETVVRPDAAPPGGAVPGAAPSEGGGPSAEATSEAVPEAVATKAAALGATNAGAAPSAPGETGAPPVNVTVSEERQVPDTGAGESAGTAPTLP